MADVNTIERTAPGTVSCFSLLALVLLGTRFVQGFIFWGGASRRLIYNFHEVNGAEVAASSISTRPASSPTNSPMPYPARCGSRGRSSGRCNIRI